MNKKVWTVVASAALVGALSSGIRAEGVPSGALAEADRVAAGGSAGLDRGYDNAATGAGSGGASAGSTAVDVSATNYAAAGSPAVSFPTAGRPDKAPPKQDRQIPDPGKPSQAEETGGNIGLAIGFLGGLAGGALLASAAGLGAAPAVAVFFAIGVLGSIIGGLIGAEMANWLAPRRQQDGA